MVTIKEILESLVDNNQTTQMYYKEQIEDWGEVDRYEVANNVLIEKGLSSEDCPNLGECRDLGHEVEFYNFGS
jgi:hypothetical protein